MRISVDGNDEYTTVIYEFEDWKAVVTQRNDSTWCIFDSTTQEPKEIHAKKVDVHVLESVLQYVAEKAGLIEFDDYVLSVGPVCSLWTKNGKIRGNVVGNFLEKAIDLLRQPQK